MKLEEILESCREVQAKARYVKINEAAVDSLVRERDFGESKHWLGNNPFGIMDLSAKEIVNLLVLYDAINYSFWGEPKWAITTEDGKVDGSFGLLYAFLKMLRRYGGKLDFTEITEKEFAEALQGEVEIPLLRERYVAVREISEAIKVKMGGDFYEYVKDIHGDERLFGVITENFASLRDESEVDGRKVGFYKLAQLMTSDILRVREMKEGVEVDVSHLVGCADYKIPQVLRGLGVLEYDEKLAERVDAGVELMRDSREENEIRAAMVVAIDMIKARAERRASAMEINDAIWAMGQDKSLKLKPYHRVRTTRY